jgi:hypothetical protein
MPGNHTNGPNAAEEAITLTPEQYELVREAIEAKERGEANYSAEQVLDYARSKVNAGGALYSSSIPR